MIQDPATTAEMRPFITRIEAGELIFNEGDLGTEMYVIQDGRVEIFRDVQGEARSLAILEKGDFFGEMALLEDLPRNASARALDDSHVLEVNGSTFGQMLHDNPEIAIRMMRKLSRRFRHAAEYLRDVGGLEAVQRSLEEQRTTPRALAAQYLSSDETAERLFLSAGAATTIGRRDPVTGIEPDLDLTFIDPQRSTSRRHAKIHRRGGRFFVTEEIGATNGTFVGETRLRTGAPVEVTNGVVLRFGLVHVTFRSDD